MTLEKCIEQLKGLRWQYENPYSNKEDNPFAEDIEAIDTALAAIEELKEAKRLLGIATKTLNDGSCNKDCRQCKWNGNCEMSCRFAWRYGDEVMKLIGEDESENSN